MMSTLLFWAGIVIIGFSIYMIATVPDRTTQGWLATVGGILLGGLGVYASLKLFPREAAFMSALYARAAQRTK
jgi:hypothetical membrane protein